MEYLLKAECEDGTLLYNNVTSELMVLEGVWNIGDKLPELQPS